MRGSIVVERIGKQFRRRAPAGSRIHEGPPREGGLRRAGEHFWALQDVSLRIEPGRSIGVIGNNGAGKSTLLRLIGGVGVPDTGRVSVSGRIGAILDLGVGLSDDLTGRENAYIVGVITGMTRGEIRRRFDEIVSFAELEEFIDSPLRTYSSGMRMRLAFSVAVHMDPDILLVDEALAVGDIAFQRKCLNRIAEVRQAGCTTLLVSHDMSHLRALCDDLLYLERGRSVAFGATSEVMALYEASSEAESECRSEGVSHVAQPSLQASPIEYNSLSPQAAVTQVRLLNSLERPAGSVLSGTGLIIELDYRSGSGTEQVETSVEIRRAGGTVCFAAAGEIPEILAAGGEGTLRLTIARIDLVPGEYVVSVGLRMGIGTSRHTSPEQLKSLSVAGSYTGTGIINPPVQWQVMSVA
jgi:lipopolysaccharide transport system ATP-binding protein